MPRKAALKADADLETETEAPEAAAPLDGDVDAVVEYRSGSVVEGELELARSVAKRMGWTPKEDWKRDPAKWRDAPEYLEQTPKELDSLKERLRRTSQAAADAVEDERRRARIEAQNEIKAAAQAGDAERAERAAQQLERVAGPPPQTVAWIGRNPWFQEDPDAQAMAVITINRLAQQGASIEDQLAEAERAVKRRFPEHFGQAERDQDPAPDTRRAAPIPPQVQAPGRSSGDARTKAKTFADIPAADRAQAERFFIKRYMGHGLSKPDAEAKYAASYWRNKE